MLVPYRITLTIPLNEFMGPVNDNVVLDQLVKHGKHLGFGEVFHGCSFLASFGGSDGKEEGSIVQTRLLLPADSPISD